MDIHEYQAKALLAEYDVPIANGGLAYSPEQAAYRAKEIGGGQWVVKAQVHSGARGKAGGIRMCDSEDEVWEAADDLLGRRLVVRPETHGTGSTVPKPSRRTTLVERTNHPQTGVINGGTLRRRACIHCCLNNGPASRHVPSSSHPVILAALHTRRPLHQLAVLS